LSERNRRAVSRVRFRGVELDLSSRTHIMGVLNVTPDSFSDGGVYLDPARAIAHAEEMIEAGADVVDVGGESTRPGSDPVPADVEWRRVEPVLKGILDMGSGAAVSIDTWKKEVAERALDLGAHAINDISGLQFDPSLADLAARCGAGLIVSHIKGTPKDMQADPRYDDVVSEIREFLAGAASHAVEAGVAADSIMVDPGIGFGKKLEHNLEIIRRLREIAHLGYPVLVGPSRKSFIGAILNLPAAERLEGTLAASVLAVANGAAMVRVHDVKEARRAIAVADAIIRS